MDKLAGKIDTGCKMIIETYYFVSFILSLSDFITQFSIQRARHG